MRHAFPALLLTLTAACAAETGPQTSTSSADTPDTPDAIEASDASSPAETGSSAEVAEAGDGGLYALEASALDGTAVDLSDYAGQVTLVVNVASRCGYTRQYAGLQELHAELADQGFAVLAFPSNEFGGQEPGSAAEIREFCDSRFGVSFPMFAKCEVKSGAGQSPVYALLEEQTGETPGWNFCKYLVGKDGRVIAFYKSGVDPDSAELREAIETALG